MRLWTGWTKKGRSVSSYFKLAKSHGKTEFVLMLSYGKSLLAHFNFVVFVSLLKSCCFRNHIIAKLIQRQVESRTDCSAGDLLGSQSREYSSSRIDWRAKCNFVPRPSILFAC